MTNEEVALELTKYAVEKIGLSPEAKGLEGHAYQRARLTELSKIYEAFRYQVTNKKAFDANLKVIPPAPEGK